MRVFLLILPVLLFLSFPAAAQEVYECGVPDDHPTIDNMDDEASMKYCDIHARRFAYIEQQERFRRRMDIRRRNYVEYRGLAKEIYKDELAAYHAGIE